MNEAELLGGAFLGDPVPSLIESFWDEIPPSDLLYAIDTFHLVPKSLKEVLFAFAKDRSTWE
jgi:hypothetical protein